MKFKYILVLCSVSFLFMTGCEKSVETTKKTPEVLKKIAGTEKQVNFVIKQRVPSSLKEFEVKSESTLEQIAKIKENPEKYNGKQVSLKVKEGIRKNDNIKDLVPLFTRSDCYVHDDSGTIMLYLGWQHKNAYFKLGENNPEYVYTSTNIKIDSNGWEINPYVYVKNGQCILSLEEMK